MGMETEVRDPGVERRVYPRLFRSAEVKYRNFLKPTKEFSGTLAKDISAGGLRISGTQILPKDSRLVVEFSLPEGLRPIRTIARVAWQRQKAYSEGCELGIRFLEIMPEDRDRIADFVERGVVISGNFPSADLS
ncbi:MAG: hypothetical protein COV76_03530 [Candidatus Omnitrophica bacterium CG11_big_fil_rev_8_21_14_0_20_64_10]|nr:MAG: hypothetical protein COV76_03530 [Candidatus Omnitrophica bacterium CG11_big_fil_rev_8_21_14_0_20_64_10]